jgi:iron complex transport system ATP-binding protein
LDEPTSALDIGHQQQVLELIDRMRNEHRLTVLAAFHDLTLAAQYCDKLILLAGGTVVAEGEPRLVLDEETIATHYGARVRVLDNGMGLAVVPVRRVASGGEESTDA